MRTLAIGDIHGCSAALDALLTLVAPAKQDVVVTLGDYVDRGPDSAGVIDRLLQLARATILVPLRGNHEQMMVDARDSPGDHAMWMACGGDAALRSYSTEGAAAAVVPEAHWQFLERTCRDYHETPTHLFVHAGVHADLPMEDQPSYILRWEVFNDPPPHASGKIVICGHTPQRDGRPRNIGHAVCSDTHAHARDGWLTCLEAETGRVYQANQAGQTRTSWLDEYLTTGRSGK